MRLPIGPDRALPGAAQCAICSACTRGCGLSSAGSAAAGSGPGVLSGRRAKGFAGLGGAIWKPLVAARAGAKGARDCWRHGHSARASGRLDPLMGASSETALARTGGTTGKSQGAAVAQTPHRAATSSESSVAKRIAGRRTGSIRKVCGKQSPRITAVLSRGRGLNRRPLPLHPIPAATGA